MMLRESRKLIRAAAFWSQFWSHWCTICLSVVVWLLMRPQCGQVTAGLVFDVRIGRPAVALPWIRAVSNRL
jgi:hypothetical protein